jgi:putative ABC transport system ATP-binding protein
MADEPTGNLDTKSGEEVLRIFQDLNDQGITIIFVTHDPEIAEYGNRVIHIRDGLIERDEATEVAIRARGNGNGNGHQPRLP